VGGGGVTKEVVEFLPLFNDIIILRQKHFAFRFSSCAGNTVISSTKKVTRCNEEGNSGCCSVEQNIPYMAV